jgi:hypothetical protein
MLSRNDVKGALAASTVAQMGFMVMQIGLGAYAHALLHIVAHGLFKAALFLGAAGTPGARAAAPTDPRLALAVTGVGGLLLLAAAPQAGASGALALFALATAAQSAVAALGPRPGVGRVMLTAGALIGCAALYMGGLAGAFAILGPQAVATSGVLAWAAALGLFGLWAAFVARGCPPSLRVALMSTGALRRSA